MARFQDCIVDPAIVARARRGDRKAHEVLYRTYSVAVYTLARRIVRVPEVADEILQDTFIEVIRKIGGFRGDAPLGAWLRRIATNKALMHLRSAWERYGQELEPIHEDRAGALAGRDTGSRVQVQSDLESALARLSPDARMVIWLYDVEGYTHREIAELAGKTESYSKSQLARAHKRLREMLDGQGTDQCMQA